MKSVLLVAAAMTLSACANGYAWSPNHETGYGRVASSETAIAAALALTDLGAPVTVIGSPMRGRATELYTGVRGSCGEDSACASDAAARRERTAWRVDLAGVPPSPCPIDPCPPLVNEQLVIDEETGVLLYSSDSDQPLTPGIGFVR